MRTIMTEEDEEFQRLEREAKMRALEDDDIQDYKKPWVGLTDEEVELYWDWEDWQTGAGRSTILEMVRDIESKLRGKNI